MSEQWLIAVIAVVLLALIVWLLVARHSPPILVSIYGDVQEAQIMSQMVGDFHSKHPRIEVEFIQHPFQEYARKILASIGQVRSPDVVLMDSIHYAEFVTQGVLEPLNVPFLDSKMSLDVYFPQAIERFFLDGYLYAVPRDVAPICLIYYNKRAFEEAGLPPPQDGWDWNQFVETAKKLTKRDASGKVTRWGFVEGWNMTEAWIYGAGGTTVDDPKRPTRWTLCTDRKSLEGFQFRWDLIHKHQVMPPPSVWDGDGDTASSEMFAEGRVAMILQGLWKTPRFREIRDFKWDVALVPRHPSGHLNFVLTGSAYGITRSSRNKKAAWKFLRYVTGEEAARKMSADGLNQPALEKIAQSADFFDDQAPRNKKVLLQAMKHGRYCPLCLNWYDIDEIIHKELADVWKGKEPLEKAMARLAPILESNPPKTSLEKVEHHTVVKFGVSSNS